jgi:adenine/guanine phosphoribosyltransferase-like PRPP-binding protein
MAWRVALSAAFAACVEQEKTTYIVGVVDTGFPFAPVTWIIATTSVVPLRGKANC